MKQGNDSASFDDFIHLLTNLKLINVQLGFSQNYFVQDVGPSNITMEQLALLVWKRRTVTFFTIS